MLELQLEEPLLKHLSKTFKKLISVLATFVPVTKTSKKNNVVLERVFCIYYPIWFKNNKV